MCARMEWSFSEAKRLNTNGQIASSAPEKPITRTNAILCLENI